MLIKAADNMKLQSKEVLETDPNLERLQQVGMMVRNNMTLNTGRHTFMQLSSRHQLCMCRVIIKSDNGNNNSIKNNS